MLPDVMIPTSLAVLLDCFRPCFTAPTFQGGDVWIDQIGRRRRVLIPEDGRIRGAPPRDRVLV